MLFTGNAVFTSIAVGAMLMVAVALIGSLSILPALLAKLGDRVDTGRIPFLGRRNAGRESRIWGFVLDGVLRRPVVSAVLSRRRARRARRAGAALHTQLPSFTDLPSRCRSSAPTSRSSARSRAAQSPAKSWSRRAT